MGGPKGNHQRQLATGKAKLKARLFMSIHPLQNVLNIHDELAFIQRLKNICCYCNNTSSDFESSSSSSRSERSDEDTFIALQCKS